MTVLNISNGNINTHDVLDPVRRIFDFLFSVIAMSDSVLTSKNGTYYPGRAITFLSRIPKNLRVGFLLLSSATIEAKNFHIFLLRTELDAVGDDLKNYEYVQFLGNEIEQGVVYMRFLMLIFGVVAGIIGLILPDNIMPDKEYFKNGGFRWYERGVEPIYPAIMTLLNVCGKIIIPVIVLRIAVTDFANVETFVPVEIKNKPMTLLLELSGEIMVAALVLGQAFSHLVYFLNKNYKTIHFWEIFAQAYLITYLHPDIDDSEIFVGIMVVVGLILLYVVQEFINNDKFGLDHLEIFWFNPWIFTDALDRTIETVAIICGTLSLITFFVGFYGPWVHVKGQTGSMIDAVSAVLETLGDVLHQIENGFRDVIHTLEDFTFCSTNYNKPTATKAFETITANVNNSAVAQSKLKTYVVDSGLGLTIKKQPTFDYNNEYHVSANEIKCRQHQCDAIIAAVSVAAVAAAAEAALGEIPIFGALLDAAAEVATEVALLAARVAWRVYKILSFFERLFHRFLKRLTGFTSLHDVFKTIHNYENKVLAVSYKIVYGYLQVFGVSLYSFFIGFWRRKNIRKDGNNETFNLIFVLMFGMALLNGIIFFGMFAIPNLFNDLLSVILPKEVASVQVKLLTGYYLIMASSFLAFVSASLWTAVLFTEKTEQFFEWFISANPRKPYIFGTKLISDDVKEQTFCDSWSSHLQTLVFVLPISMLIMHAFYNESEFIRVTRFGQSSHLINLKDLSKHTPLFGDDFSEVHHQGTTMCGDVLYAVFELIKDGLNDLLELIYHAIYQLANTLVSIDNLHMILLEVLNLPISETLNHIALIVCFAPAIGFIGLYFIGVVSFGLFGCSNTTSVWIRYGQMTCGMMGLTFTLACQTYTHTFGSFEIPVFHFKIEFTNLVLQSQVTSILILLSYAQWRFDTTPEFALFAGSPYTPRNRLKPFSKLKV